MSLSIAFGLGPSRICSESEPKFVLHRYRRLLKHPSTMTIPFYGLLPKDDYIAARCSSTLLSAPNFELSYRQAAEMYYVSAANAQGIQRRS